MAFSSYLLRKSFANPGEALRIKRAGDEVRAYAVWKLYEVLEGSGSLAKLQEQPWWSFGDRDLARVVCDTLVAEGLADRTGDVIRVKRRPQRPAITTREAADFAPSSIERFSTSLAPPPASGELHGMIREAGFSIEKWLESLGVVIAKAAPE